MPALTPASIEPDILFSFAASAEPELKQEFLRLESTSRNPEDCVAGPRLVEQSAHFLEVLLVGAFLHEELAREGCASHDVSAAMVEELRTRTLAMYGLDIQTVAEEAREHLGIVNSEGAGFSLSVDAVVRLMESVLEICPIDHIEELASKLSLEDRGHRCRVAYDGIKTFVFRNSSRQRDRISVIGRAYVDGHMSIGDASTLLDLHPVDVVPLFESHGFKRGIDQMTLSGEQRNQMFSAMREDRVQRNGAIEWTRETVARDVVASERIESVDARRWIPRGGQ